MPTLQFIIFLFILDKIIALFYLSKLETRLLRQHCGGKPIVVVLPFQCRLYTYTVKKHERKYYLTFNKILTSSQLEYRRATINIH